MPLPAASSIFSRRRLSLQPTSSSGTYYRRVTDALGRIAEGSTTPPLRKRNSAGESQSLQRPSTGVFRLSHRRTRSGSPSTFGPASLKNNGSSPGSSLVASFDRPQRDFIQMVKSPFGNDNFEADGSVDKGSLRSSEEAAGSGFEEEDEKSRLERKIQLTREHLKRVVLAREADVEEYIRMSGGLASGSGGPENPQLMRIRQHFEKKNKKHAQETDRFQKKLEQQQQRLAELESGMDVQREKKGLSHVGYGLKGIKETISSTTGGVFEGIRGGLTGLSAVSQNAAGSVISVPRDIASRLKNKFGSADNIPATVDEKHDIAMMGQGVADIPRSIHGSTFYADLGDPSDHDRSRAYSAGAQTIGSDPTQKRQGYPGRTSIVDDSSSNLASLYTEIRDEIRDLRSKQTTGLDTIDTLKNQMQNEYNYYHNVLHEERFRYQRLEEQLNDTIELHQAEIVNLKTDMQGIANRMEYQYMNRFRDLQEMVEASQNRMLQLEQKMASDALGGVAGPSLVHSITLSTANILVETLKIVLFLSSVVLDTLKPFTGTRSRAAVFLGVLMLIAVTTSYLDVWTLIARILPGRRTVANVTAAATDVS